MEEGDKKLEKKGKSWLFKIGIALFLLFCIYSLLLLYLHGGLLVIIFLVFPIALFLLFLVLIGYSLKRKEKTKEKQYLNFPIKTKIVAWILILIGLIGGLASTTTLFLFKSWCFGRCPTISISDLLYCTSPFVLFIPGFFLLKRKKWAWWLAVLFSIFIFTPTTLLFQFTLGFLKEGLIIIFSLIIILLFLDRKNFFKIAD